MKVEFYFENEAIEFSNPIEVLIGEGGRFKEAFSGCHVNDPKSWMAEKSKDYFLAGTIGYECAWDFCKVNYDRPNSNGHPDLIVGLFTKLSPPQTKASAPDFKLTPKRVLEKEKYSTAVESAVESIFNGDLFEVNFTSQTQFEFIGSSEALFTAMRNGNQGAWFSALHFENLHILSSSPECFLTVDANRRVRTDPIKGTETLLNRKDIQSEKNRAENVMIVDLMRNDLSKHCVPGSVVVTDLFREEEVGNLVHLVSTVEGNLPNNIPAIELLCDCFPAGSITGAPKLRAIEIAADLEKEKRGFYCGSMFYSKPNGELKSSVLIRTATLSVIQESKPDNYILTYGTGGAVVSDSDPVLEYEEAVDKLGPILKFVTNDI